MCSYFNIPHPPKSKTGKRKANHQKGNNIIISSIPKTLAKSYDYYRGLTFKESNFDFLYFKYFL